MEHGAREASQQKIKKLRNAVVQGGAVVVYLKSFECAVVNGIREILLGGVVSYYP